MLAVVTAGIYLGWRTPELTSVQTRLQAAAAWEILTFVINALVFALVGLQLSRILDALTGLSAGRLTLYAVLVTGTVVITRVFWLPILSYLPRRLFSRSAPAPFAQTMVISWSGLRGAVSLAAALAIPLTTDSGARFPQRELIVFLTFAVILGTLVVQGLSLPVLIRALRLEPDHLGAPGARTRADDRQRLARGRRRRPRLHSSLPRRGALMAPISRGFRGRRRAEADPARIPPGQYVTDDFPVLSAGPTPHTPLEAWSFTIRGAVEQPVSWTWESLKALPSEKVTVDIHCVTKWSKLDTVWTGVSLDTLLEGVETSAEHATAFSDGGYTTNLPLEDLTGGKAWITYAYDEEPLEPEHGGPARLLVPHLYFWKSAKWVRGLELREEDEPGFWETYGYHNYGDPWKEQRYWGD